MILTKRHLCAALCAIWLFVGLCVLYNRYLYPKTVPAVVSVPTQIDTVVVDAGHGGFDGGAVGVGGVAEKELNLSIAMKLQTLLRLCGYQTVMTRTSDTALTRTADALPTVSSKKTDMRARLKIMDETDHSITISVHQNKYAVAKYHGAQMFYGVNNPLSEPLAKSLQAKFVEHLQPNNKRQVKRAKKDLFLLYYTKAPAVIVECGFLSNPEECAKLCDEEYQCRVAFAICAGISAFTTQS